jgi:hypothetical protein
MVTNRSNWILITAGGMVLVLMLVTAAFALGVYVGEHGWTRDGLQYAGGAPAAGPGQQNRPATGSGIHQNGQSLQGGPGQAPAGLPPGRPQVSGRVLTISTSQVELATPDGRRSVTLVQGTRIQDEQGNTLAVNDLKSGDFLAVFGTLIQGDGGLLQADLLIRLPPR